MLRMEENWLESARFLFPRDLPMEEALFVEFAPPKGNPSGSQIVVVF